jgi:hypothetical protein
MALLDYILGQQDRVGNIDYVEECHWVKEGKVERRPASKPMPRELASYKPQRIRRTWLNDNDAGVRASYSDFAKITHELDGLRHFSAVTYPKLMALDKDLQARGALHGLLQSSFALGERELRLIVDRAHQAAEVLRRACRARRLQFDLEPEEFLVRGTVSSPAVDCSQP